MNILDPRFNLVTRGIAPYWQQLAGRWACPGYDSNYSTPQEAMEAGATYGQKILALCKQLESVTIADEDIEKYFPTESDQEPIPEPTPESTPDPEPTPEPTSEPVTQPEPTPTPVLEDKPDLATLIFNVIKKLIIMLINVFKNKKGE